MKVACIQPKVFSERNKCYADIERIVKQLLNEVDSCNIICLPERWVPFLKDLPQNLQKERGEDYSFVVKLAKEYQINIISGAIWEKRDNLKKPVITSYFINNKGEEVGRQDKIHLYALERERFEAGNELNIFKLDDFHFAILICFDMAFFETPRLAVENGVDILFSPTQIRSEGMVNWKIYLQARALENRVPVAACNVYGKFLDREFQGNSKIISFEKGFISPSKLRISEAPTNSSGFVFDDVNLIFPKKLRKRRLKQIINKDLIKVNLIK